MAKKRPYDKQMFLCMHCGHKWYLLCYDERLVTDDEFKSWIKEAKQQHDSICNK